MRVTFRCDGTLFRGNGSIRNVMGLGDSYRSDAPPHLENIAAAMQENGKVTIEPNLSDASVSSGLSPDSGTTPTSVVVVAAAILAGMVLCLHGLGAKPIWFDEGWSLGCARLPLRDSLILALYEPVQWPYYLVLRAFLSLGDSESLLRLPSALFMIASIPMLFLSARRLFGTHAALAAALLMAVHADLVKYAHEVRGYGMEIFLLTTSLYLLCRYVEQPTFRRQLAYVAVCALAVYTHMYGILVIGAQLLCLFLVPPGTVRRKDTVLTLVSICALAAPMWLFAARVPRQYTIWMGMPTWSSVYLVLQHISGNAGALSVLLSAAGLLVAMLGFAGLLLDPAKKEEAWTLLLPVLSFTLPLVTTILASLLGRPCFLGRYMLFCVPALALMMASVIGRLPNLKLMAVATSLLVVVGLFGVWSYYQEDFDVDGGVRENYPELARFIASNAMPGDGIILYWAGMRVNYEYYLDRIPGSFARPAVIYPTRLYGRENFQLLSSAWFPSDAPPPRASGYRRVWFVAHKFAIQYNDPMVSTIGSAIQNQYGFTAEREFPDWTVFLYSADTSF